MSRNGQLCLERVIISYGVHSGNPAVRQFIALQLPRFKARFPTVTIDLRPRQWPERAVTGVYRDGSERAYNIKDLSSMGIATKLYKLANEANDFDVPFTASHMHFQRKSVQGAWNPYLWMGERHEARKEQPRWDRQLNEREWDYYVDQYSERMRQDEEAIAARANKWTDLPNEYTQEVAQRWKAHVAPRLQTDLEHNLDVLKISAKAGKKHAPVTMGEYQLFSVPDHGQLGQDAAAALRKRETRQLEAWWRQRSDQLKPPA